MVDNGGSYLFYLDSNLRMDDYVRLLLASWSIGRSCQLVRFASWSQHLKYRSSNAGISYFKLTIISGVDVLSPKNQMCDPVFGSSTASSP